MAFPADFFAGAEEREPGIEIGLGLSDLFVLSVNLVAQFFDCSLSSPVTSNGLSNLRLLLVLVISILTQELEQDVNYHKKSSTHC